MFEIIFETFDSLGTDEYVDDSRAILKRKGFKAYYKFSSTDFFSTDYMTGVHVKGTRKLIPYAKSKVIKHICKDEGGIG